jgi:hypothetical protein
MAKVMIHMDNSLILIARISFFTCCDVFFGVSHNLVHGVKPAAFAAKDATHA